MLLPRTTIYEFSVSGWGWIHLVLGIVLAVTGYFILSGQPWARAVGIAVAALSALANFLFIPYYPIWALVIIALDVAVIWALSTYRPESSDWEWRWAPGGDLLVPTATAVDGY